jgi:hypothetical protein
VGALLRARADFTPDCSRLTNRRYENVVSPVFTGTNAVVYVVPETRASRDVFGSYDVESRERVTSTGTAR